MRMHTLIDQIASRLQESGDAVVNRSLANAPWAHASLPGDLIERVDYVRVPFNYPDQSIPQANFFAIRAMALDCLASAGYGHEKKQLQRVFELIEPPAYGELPQLLHLFLDFGPGFGAQLAATAKIAELARELGVPESSVRIDAPIPDNPIASSKKTHNPRNIEEEWNWLVEKAGQKNQYGKDAIWSLGPQTVSVLVNNWLPIVHETPDPNSGNLWERRLAWFEKEYPLGWFGLDHLHESPVIGGSASFEQRISIALFQCASMVRRGWSLDQALLLGIRHKAEHGIDGEAFLAIQATELVAAITDSAAELLGEKHGAAAKVPALSSAAKEFISTRIGRDAASADAGSLLWAAYALISPRGAAQIHKLLQTHKGSDKQKAFIERFAIDAIPMGTISPANEDPMPRVSTRPKAPSL